MSNIVIQVVRVIQIIEKINKNDNKNLIHHEIEF